jgi:SAM-dependent methyltransferase
MRTVCPNCCTPGLETVYEVQGIPVHSCILVPSREEALHFPKGDLALGWCRECGFGTNQHFDVEMNDYNPEYEEVQTFSPTFNDFSSSLIDRLIEKHHLRGKSVVEIGCGKGEFLLELCERGGNRGFGIDPSFRPGRGQWDPKSPVQFFAELYDAKKHGALEADAIICRHTLEHIHETRIFMETIRASLGNRQDVLVFFELPDQERVYAERAFWDIYYEHCSYFTNGSLERLFLSTGFEVMDSWKGFGDQYLLIEAKPLGEGEKPTFSVKEDLAESANRVQEFSSDIRNIVDGWRNRFQQWYSDGKKTFIWGAGSKGVSFLTTLGIHDEVVAAVDVNPHKRGYFMPGTGHEVLAPEQLVDCGADIVVVMNPIYIEEIRSQLAGLGLTPEIVSA